MYLIIKVRKKMVENSNTSYQNEIHRETKIPKIYFFGLSGPNFRRGTAGNFKENGQKQVNLLFCKLGSGKF